MRGNTSDIASCHAQLTCAYPTPHLLAKGHCDVALAGSLISRCSQRMRYVSDDGLVAVGPFLQD
jgi:hypothetical protein